jgi:hypothetical protein
MVTCDGRRDGMHIETKGTNVRLAEIAERQLRKGRSIFEEDTLMEDGWLLGFTAQSYSVHLRIDLEIRLEIRRLTH